MSDEKKLRISDFTLVSDIQREYTELRRKGISRKDAVDTIYRMYYQELTIGTDDDGTLVRIGLADAQYQCKELMSEVATQGICALNALEATDIGRAIRVSDISSRRQNYAAAPMTEKRMRVQKKFRCGWRIGDVYAYQVTGDEAAELGILGSYFLFRKVDSVEFGDGRLLPVVTVHVWDQKTLPICPEDFAKAPMLKIRKGGRCGSPKEKHEYRAEILFKNRKQIDKMPLMFIGNYPDIEPADDEILFADAGEMCMVSPEQIDKECCLFWKWNRYCTLGIAF